MDRQFLRTELLLGADGITKLQNSRVAVFGLGGVGGCVVEALARAGVGTLDLIDSDKVEETNLNRQILATHQTIGLHKTDAAQQRVEAINPKCCVHQYPIFYLPDTEMPFELADFDYIVDAIDTVSAKIGLIAAAQTAGVPIISAMGAGNKIDPTAFEVADIYQTSVCPLAHVMRKELRQRGVRQLKVVYSKEKPLKAVRQIENENKSSRPLVASMPFVPPVVGYIIAGEVIKDLVELR